MATIDDVDPELGRAMEDSLKAYANGDSKFFTYLSDDVRVYNLDSSEPMVGRKTFEERFGPTFKTQKAVEKTHEDIRVVGKQAILSQTLQVTSGGVSIPVRQTVVWDGTGENWQMTHIHNARAGQPFAIDALPATSAGIRVLNERIATVAAVVGVAQ